MFKKFDVWIFDENRRIYAKGKVSSPIWREHWRKYEVIGETSRSWIVGYYDTKIPKKNPDPDKYCFSLSELEQKVWMHDHRYKIAELIRCGDINYGALCVAAQAIGYKE